MIVFYFTNLLSIQKLEKHHDEQPSFINPFPHTTNLQQMTFENIYSRYGKSQEMIVTLLKKVESLWQKEKLLIMSNFPFNHNVFKSRLLQTRQNASTSGKRLKHVNRESFNEP